MCTTEDLVGKTEDGIYYYLYRRTRSTTTIMKTHAMTTYDERSFGRTEIASRKRSTTKDASLSTTVDQRELRVDDRAADPSVPILVRGDVDRPAYLAGCAGAQGSAVFWHRPNFEAVDGGLLLICQRTRTGPPVR
jgi:hypothetical protein